MDDDDADCCLAPLIDAEVVALTTSKLHQQLCTCRGLSSCAPHRPSNLLKSRLRQEASPESDGIDAGGYQTLPLGVFAAQRHQHHHHRCWSHYEPSSETPTRASATIATMPSIRRERYIRRPLFGHLSMSPPHPIVHL